MPLPRGMTDMVWGNTICELKKYAHLGMSYNEMAQRASASHEMLTYLMWVKKTFGEDGIRQIRQSGSCRSQGFDLGAWLFYVGMERDEGGTQTFQRRVRA